MYLDKPAQWDKLCARLSIAAVWPLGLDSETYNQPDKTSPQHRTKIQCWSLGVYTDARSPRGYRRAQGVVLPREALEHPGLRAILENPEVPKYAHNAPHDYHSLVNEGVKVGGLVDTLQWSRVALPDLPGGYGLKDLEVNVLGKPARPTFKDVVRLNYEEVRSKREKHRACICGASPCRAKQSSEWWDAGMQQFRWHERVTWRTFSPTARPAVRQRDVSEMVPGCPDWDQWWAYALADATGVLELVDYLISRPAKWTDNLYPWRTSTL